MRKATFEKKLEKNFTSPEEEIAHLKEEIAKREKQLENRAENSTEATPAPPREVLNDYAETPNEDVLAPEYRMADQQADEIVLNLKPEPHDKQMDELLSIMIEDGLKNTLKLVQNLNDPHLEDDFHRILIQYVKEGYPLADVKEGTSRFRALHRRLFEVVLTPTDEEDRKRQIGELISAMEQLYSGLFSLSDQEKPGDFTISIEMAVEHATEEVSFYISVPDRRADMLEKQLLSLFPEAIVQELPDDYNIFNHQGVSVGSRAQPDNRAIFPIKTYDEFDHDPLAVLLNSFSKLSREGEGAAIQLVMQPAGRKFYKKYTNAIGDIEDGENVSEAIDVSTSFAGELWSTAKDMFQDKSKEEDEIDHPSDLSQEATEAIEQIQKKTASPIQSTNLRVLASAHSRERAEKILFDLESSFSQFEKSHGNGLSFRRVSKKDEEKFFHQFVFRLFDQDHLLPLNVEELATLVHFPVRDIKAARELKQSKAGTAPVPLGLPEEGISLGVNEYRGEKTEVRMAPEDRLRHMYVIGQTGTGKTTLLQNMIAQDIREGRGCCMIDPHGDVTDALLSYVPQERFNDVIYFDPAHTARPMGLNMLEYNTDYPEQKTFVVNEMLSIFNKLFDMQRTGGPMFEQYFRNAAMLVLEDPESGSTILEISRVLSDSEFRKRKLARSNNEIVNKFWIDVAGEAGGEASLENIVPYITSKFDNFLSNEIMRPIIAQQESSFDFRQVMDEEKILLVNLSKGRLGDINANLIGLILVGKILMSALSRVDVPESKRSDFFLYLDEFQNISTDSIATILSEARKYHLSLNLAHQYTDQLDETTRDAVFGNVGSMATYRVSSKDAEMMESHYEPVFDKRDLMNVDNYNYFANLLVGGEPVKPFSVRAAPPAEGNPDQVSKLKQLSYLKYGRPREEVDREIMKKLKRT